MTLYKSDEEPWGERLMNLEVKYDVTMARPSCASTSPKLKIQTSSRDAILPLRGQTLLGEG